MVLCHLTHTKFHAEFHFVDQVETSKAYTHLCAAAFNVEAGVKGVMQPGPRSAGMHPVWKLQFGTCSELLAYTLQLVRSCGHINLALLLLPTHNTLHAPPAHGRHASAGNSRA